MKLIDQSYLTMFKQVSTFMAKNKLTWQSNLIITNIVIQIDDNIAIINNADQGLQNKPSYITLVKKRLRKSLNKQAFIIKEGLRLYYSLNDMNEDMLMFTYPITKLMRMTDADFYVEASHISERAEALSAQLAPIGITAAKITTLKADLLSFYNKPPEREFTAKTNAAFVKLIPAKVKETRLLIRKQLDALIAMYDDEANHKFIVEYKTARKRNIKPGRHKYYTVLVKGRAIDAETKAVLTDVNIEVGTKKKKAITDTEGYYKVRIYIKDADTITFTKEGYEIITLNIPKKYTNHEVNVSASLNRLLGD